MDRRAEAEKLRESAESLVIVAQKLIAAADALDPPRTMATTRARTCTCDRCGDQIKGRNWIGERCCISKDCHGVKILCAGRYRLDPEPEACAKCGGSIAPRLHVLNGGMCEACSPFLVDPEPRLHVHHRDCYDDAGPGRGGVSLICGLTTSDPEPDESLTDRSGVPLDITRDRLAMEAALMMMLGDDPDNDEALDIATTFGGRAR